MKKVLFISVLAFMMAGTDTLKAQTMFTYQDAKGKVLSQAQIDQLDKKYQGFLSMEIVDEGPPMRVQVSPPSPEEMKMLQKLRQQETDELKKKWIGKSLPAFSITSLNGKILSNKALPGHPTVLFFWSKSDYASLNQLAALNKLAAGFKGKPIQFWAITFEDRVLIKSFLQKHALNFTHLPGDFTFVMEKMGIIQTPVFMILDTKGIIRFLSTSTQKNIDQLLTAEIAKIK